MRRSAKVGQWLCVGGWLLVLLLGVWDAPAIYHRLIIKLPGFHEAYWQQKLAQKKIALARPWTDSRPLVLFTGDSHIEYGDWYDLLAGGWAVRNGGLAEAKITDVTALVLAMGNQHPQTVVVMCGINSLFARLPVAQCVQDYETLLTTIRLQLQPASIIILSVMPLRESPVDPATHKINLNVAALNQSLAVLCKKSKARFVDVNPAMVNLSGGLEADLTVDGLHLNPAGYQRLASMIAAQLPPQKNQP